MKTSDWIKSRIKDREGVIKAHHEDIERAQNRIKDAEEELSNLRDDLKKLES